VPPSSQSRFRPLDGLRAVSVLMVFLVHTNFPAFVGGWLGVDVFFVISGYLITSLLLQESHRRGRVSLRRFYARRFLRLMPALAAMLVVVGTFAIHERLSRVSDVVAAATYTTDLYGPISDATVNLVSHTWSLGIEEQFYLVWPTALALLGWRQRRAVPLILVTIAVSTLATVYAIGHWSPQQVYFSPFAHLPAMGWGVLLAFALRSEPARRALAWTRQPWVPLVVVALTVAALPRLIYSTHWLYLGGLTAITLVPAVLIAHIVLAPRGWAARLLSVPPMVWLGERSYAFYLWHFPIVDYIGTHHHSHLTALLVGLPISLVVTELSWRLVETPFNRLKRYVAQPGRVRTPPAPGDRVTAG
jgi:peptidoglycan/LPS O-acetylase OafA/YrhL